MKFLFSAALILFTFSSHAAINCNGTIDQVYKWNYFETISITVKLADGTGITSWVSLPTKSDESMAMMAFVAGLPVHLYLASDDITKCVEGWSHNTPLEGYFVVSK